jgi:hypothetical protein
MGKIITIISTVIICALLLVAHLSGLFDTVKISTQTFGPVNLVYREHQGPYIGVRYILNDVYKFLFDKENIRVKKGFAIFYDDPSKMDEDSLRSIAGAVTDSLIKVSMPYKSGQFKKTEAVVGVYPIRSLLSYTTGVLKFSSAFEKYSKKNSLKQSGPTLEIYDTASKKIFYIAPVNGTVSPAPTFGDNSGE